MCERRGRHIAGGPYAAATACAGWTTTSGSHLASNPDSPANILVENYNELREGRGGGGAVIVPLQSQLLAFARPFGAEVVAFVNKTKRIPTLGEPTTHSSEGLQSAVCAFTSGLYILPSDGDVDDLRRLPRRPHLRQR